MGNYHYGQGHPMKPHRMRMAHSLIVAYGLYRKMEVHVRRHAPARARGAQDAAHASPAALGGRASLQRSPRANILDMTKFHSDDYINFLRRIKPNNTAEFAKQLQRCTRRKRYGARKETWLTHWLRHLAAVGRAGGSQRGRGLPRV